jgi:hypothetical protein
MPVPALAGATAGGGATAAAAPRRLLAVGSPISALNSGAAVSPALGLLP